VTRRQIELIPVLAKLFCSLAVPLCALPDVALAAAAPGPGSLFSDCADCPEMVIVPAGEFVMGAAPGEEERENLAAEFRGRSAPQHRVKVRSFAAGRFEITRGQYRAFADATGRASDGCFVWARTGFELNTARDWRNTGYPQDDAHPASCVSWEDASAYASWLGRRTGRSYRLLTEAEWEYAARAGSATARYWGDDPGGPCDHANGADLATVARVAGAESWSVADCNDRHAYTAPVGSFRANAFGLHDVLGNVEEWTQDCWNGNLSGVPSDGSAATVGTCALRAVRGGSWDDAPVGLRAAYRVGSPTTVRVYRRGFRVARDIE
jgi:formylglycine-generating enzyme required for sulfatase activity